MGTDVSVGDSDRPAAVGDEHDRACVMTFEDSASNTACLQGRVFDSERQRRADQVLFGRWLLTQHMLVHPLLLTDLPFLCGICDMASRVSADAGELPDMREGLACRRCGMSARMRVAVAMLDRVATTQDRVYVTEQSTPLYALLQARYPNLRGSEFEPDAGKRDAMAAHLSALGGSGAIEFQDVTRLTLPDGSQDVVASFDVLEHVPDYRAALREFARVLRAGGTLHATFPFTDGPSTLVRARLGDNGVEHLMEPEFHGDPIGGAVLCFYHFGWDILDEVLAAGFRHATMVSPWAPECGIYYGHWVLQATR